MTLAAHNVSLTINGTDIVSEVDLAIEPSTVTALVGPNGAGKTSLLRMLTGEAQPSNGFVSLDDWPLKEFGLQEQARRRSVMTQHNHVAFDFSVADILELAWEPYRHKAPLPRDIEQHICQQCDIAHLRARIFNTLSGGERQRVQFARALLQLRGPNDGDDNRYLILDEPTSSLDVAHELDLLRMTRNAAQSGIGVCIVLHDLNLAARFCDRIVLLEQGHVIADGPPAECLTSERLSSLYKTAIQVEWHAQLDRMVIHS
ncbi:MAG: heme ABC transporter ATP-binding protein [Pseudomonadota bacterium]